MLNALIAAFDWEAVVGILLLLCGIVCITVTLVGVALLVESWIER